MNGKPGLPPEPTHPLERGEFANQGTKHTAAALESTFGKLF
jgi:hypothetical protein